MEDPLYTITNQIAVCLEDCIWVLCKTTCFQVSDYTISICNLWTEQWRQYAIPKQQELPEVEGPTGVVIGTDVYLFGSHYNSKLWKLTRNRNASFEWSKIHIADQTKVPSPRTDHCAWEHGGEMWVFGGYGPAPIDYLNDHGNFIYLSRLFGVNSQLFSYSPTTGRWTNVKCSGEVPSPRDKLSTAEMQDNVWLYGGLTENSVYSEDLYKLSMHSLVWTKIEATMARPNASMEASLTPISASQLVLFGGIHMDMHLQKPTRPWIFDIQSHTLFSIMFSAMLSDAFRNGDVGIKINYRMDGKLFNLRQLKAKTKVMSEIIKDFLFADDCALNAGSEEDMQESVDKFSTACSNFGLTISIKKTEVLNQPPPGKIISEPNITVHGSRSNVV